MTSTTIGVGEAKKRFSEIMSRVVYGGERFIVSRRGKPMVALVSADDLEMLDGQAEAPRGLLAAVGAIEDFEELDDIVKAIYRQRQDPEDRPIDLDA